MYIFITQSKPRVTKGDVIKEPRYRIFEESPREHITRERE